MKPLQNVRYAVNGLYRFVGAKELHKLERVFDLGMGFDYHEETVHFARCVATESAARQAGVDLNMVIWLRFSAFNADDHERDLALLAAWQNGEPIR